MSIWNCKHFAATAVLGLVLSAQARAAAMDLSVLEAARSGTREQLAAALKAGGNANERQPDGASALAWAVHRDDETLVDLLISAKADLNAANDYGITPLHLACQNENGAMVRKLADAGANPNTSTWTGETPLMTCSRTGVPDGVAALLAHKADVNAKDARRGQSALMWAIAEHHPDVAALLIDKGADINAQSRQMPGYSPKVYKTYYGTLEVSSRGGFTPLMFAASVGDLESAKKLVARGANVNHSTYEDGNTLLLAAANGHEDVALFLLESGADPNSKAGDGSNITALHYALRDGMKSLMESKGAGFFSQIVQQEQASVTNKSEAAGPLDGTNMPRLAKALLARGADVNARLGLPPARLRKGGRAYVSVDGATPFVLAAASGDVAALKLLAEAGANRKLGTVVDEKEIPVGKYSDDAQFQGSATALLAAAGLGRSRDRRGAEAQRAFEAVKTLVEMGEDVNQVNETGWTALHAASYIGADNIVEYLVQKGAKTDVQNGCGQTPLTLANGTNARGLIQIPRERKSTTELLKRLGASEKLSGKPVGRCVEGRYGIEYFTERDSKIRQEGKQ
jgi:ankyrin repeat protein